MRAKLYLDVEFDEKRTDAEGIAAALDRLLETALSTPGIMDEYGGEPKVSKFFVLDTGRAAELAEETGLPHRRTGGRRTGGIARSRPGLPSECCPGRSGRIRNRKQKSQLPAMTYIEGNTHVGLFSGRDHDRRQGPCRAGRGVRQGSRRHRGFGGWLRRLSLRPQAAAAYGSPGRERVLVPCGQSGSFGMFEELEAFCVKHGISFDRHSDAFAEYDAENVSYRPGMKEPGVSSATQSGDALLRAEEVQKVLDLLKTYTTGNESKAGLEEGIGQAVARLTAALAHGGGVAAAGDRGGVAGTGQNV